MMKPIQDRISSLFYFHGLFCASHPFATIAFVIAIIISTCYPLTKLPLPGNAPLEYTTPVQDYEPPMDDGTTSTHGVTSASDDFKRPRWYVGPPLAYVQQVVIRAAVSPWQHKSLIPTDSFRATLYQVFSILDQLNTFQYKDEAGSESIDDVCLHVAESIHSKLRGVLPEYSCLTVSPASLWNRNKEIFSEDGQIMKTVHKKFGQPIDASPSVADILFGLAWKDTGVPRFSQFYFRNRQRVISYAITIVLKEYNPNFLADLEHQLKEKFQVATSSNETENEALSLVHVHFRDLNYFVEYTPLLVAYVVLFLYLYFSVRKIEMVKSKSGLAFSAVFVVIASLFMSIGIVTFFGMSPSLNGSEIFPYLVVIIGLENVLVVTRSVVNTPVHLEVRYRVAQGLSKEGWSIFKNLMTEFFALMVGFLSMVPAIQEFCLFAVVGLATDFFLQMVFFTTVLSIDIRRMELSDLQKQAVYQGLPEADPVVPQQPMYCPVVSHSTPGRLTRNKSTNMLNMAGGDGTPPSPLGSGDGLPAPIMKLPKRLRFLFFWARTRMLQRILMFALIVWSIFLGYKSGVFDQLVEVGLTDGNHTNSIVPPIISRMFFHPSRHQHQVNTTGSNPADYAARKMSEDHKRIMRQLVHEDKKTWSHLSYRHWPTLFGYYNVSLKGRYITILPSMHISTVVSPEEAIRLRHPSERAQPDLPESEIPHDMSHSYLLPVLKNSKWARMMFPQTSVEVVFTLLFLLATMAIFGYFLVMLYKIVCSRNYAKWRSQWARVRGRVRRNGQYVKQVRESVPIILEGHTQEVECVAPDGQLVVSTCLGGQIRVWDSNSGECLTVIHRRSATPLMVRTPAPGRNIDDSDADLYAEYHESPVFTGNSHQVTAHTDPNPPKKKTRRHTRNKSADWAVLAPDLTSTIDTNFTTLAKENIQTRKERTNSDPSQPPDLNDMEHFHQGDDGGIEIPSESPAHRHKRTSSGFDFSQFDSLYHEHQLTLVDQNVYMEHRARQKQSIESLESLEDLSDYRKNRTYSLGSSPNTVEFDATLDSNFQNDTAPPIWCLACRDNLVIAGCGNGRIEIWDGVTGCLKCLYEDCKVGVTNVCFVGDKVIVGRISGYVDFLELETFIRPPIQPPTTPSGPKLHNRGHIRHLSSSGSISEMKSWDDIIHCSLVQSTRAHQQPISIMLSEGGRVVTASHDHRLKVFRLEDQLCLYTLHRHKSPITALYLDKMAPLGGASGSQDGSVRLWDMVTGTCVHTLKAHTDAITEISCTALHAISIGLDDKMCIWERSRGQLLHSIEMHPGQCNSVSVLTNNLMVTGGQGYIYLWDIQKGDILRSVCLSEHTDAPLIRQVEVIGNAAVVCNFSSELRVVHFPTVLEKAE